MADRDNLSNVEMIEHASKTAMAGDWHELCKSIVEAAGYGFSDGLRN